MGNLSEHFNIQDFTCRCGKCDKKYRISLSLVGALEAIGSHFRRPVKVVEAYRCEDHPQADPTSKKDYHYRGKAANVIVEGVKTSEVYKFAETLPEIKEIIYYPTKSYLHLATGGDEKRYFVQEFESNAPLTPEKKIRYGLAEAEPLKTPETVAAAAAAPTADQTGQAQPAVAADQPGPVDTVPAPAQS